MGSLCFVIVVSCCYVFLHDQAVIQSFGDAGIRDLGIGILSTERPGFRPGRTVKQIQAVFRCRDG